MSPSVVPPDILQDREALDRWLTDLEKSALLTVAAAIGDDIEGAARRFAEHTAKCLCCAQPLTDATSVAYGIGPTCRRRLNALLKALAQ